MAAEPKSVKVWFPIYIGDFFTTTASMTGHEIGAYITIIAQLWKADGSIKADDRQLAKLVKATPKQWPEIKETLWPLFEIKAGMLTHPATSAEIDKAKKLSAKKAEAAAVRWAAKHDADAMQVHSECNADGMPRACDGEGEGLYQGSATGEGKDDRPFRVVDGKRL